MAVPQRQAVILPLGQERRRFQRVSVNLLGRYMLADRREFPCQVVDMSPGGMAIVGPVSGNEDERVVAYIDHVGRDRKSTRLNSSHSQISYAVFCLKQKNPRPL